MAVYVGGIQAEIQYQGASGYPGVNQVNVIIPANAPTGCFVSVVGVTSLPECQTNFLDASHRNLGLATTHPSATVALRSPVWAACRP